MICCASYGVWTARGSCLVALVLIAFMGCTRSQPPPLLRPDRPKPSAQPSAIAQPAVAYRTAGGEPIAPMIVSDDPPAAALAAAGDHKGPTQNTLNGDPGGLTRDSLNHAISSAMSALASCFSPSAQDPMVAISFEAAPSGHPSLVRVNGAPPDVDHCLREVVQNIHFPPFEGKGVQVDVPLAFHRVPRSAQPAAPTAEQQAPALFLQP